LLILLETIFKTRHTHKNILIGAFVIITQYEATSMNAKTRILPALLLAAALLPASVRAATSGPYTYTVADNKATITEFDTTYSGALSITNELGGCPVTSIGHSAFFDCKSLTAVTIPASVTSIGESAFSSPSITAINVSENNPNYASFDGALFNKDLTTLLQCPPAFSGHYTITNSVTSIGDGAFAGC